MNRHPPRIRAPARRFAATCAGLLGVVPLACADPPTKDTRSCSGISFVGTQRDTLECSEVVQWLELTPSDAGADAAQQPFTRVDMGLREDDRYYSDYVTLRLRGLPERNVWNDFDNHTAMASVRVVLPNGVWFTDPPGAAPSYSDEPLDPAREATAIGRIRFSEILTEAELRARIAQEYGSHGSPSYYFYGTPTHARIEMRLTPKDRSIPEQEILITF